MVSVNLMSQYKVQRQDNCAYLVSPVNSSATEQPIWSVLADESRTFSKEDARRQCNLLKWHPYQIKAKVVLH